MRGSMPGLAVTGLLCLGLGVSPLLAQAPTPDEFVRKFRAPSSPTRSIGAKPVTRQIVVEPNEPPGEVIEKVKGQPALNVRVQFGYDSDRLTPEGVKALAPFGAALQNPELKEVRFLVAGHTDATGSDSYNDDLSNRRARSVVEHVMQTYRIDPSRLSSKGFGKRSPVEADPFSAGNRRVEVISLTQFAQQ